MTPEIKLVEWFDEHWYKIRHGENLEFTDYIPSVTTKLGIVAKPFLAKWRGDIGNREADLRMYEASERGVRLHNGWQILTTGGVIIFKKSLADYKDSVPTVDLIVERQDEMVDLHKLSRWLHIVNPEVYASELIVYSLTHKDAGTADNIFDIEGGEYFINGAKALTLPKGRYIADLKTGNMIDDDAFWQIAAYAKCFEEMGYGQIDGGLIIHTGSKTKTGIEGLSTLYRTKEQMEQDYQTYRLAAALWERKNADAKPKVFEFPTLLIYSKELKNV